METYIGTKIVKGEPMSRSEAETRLDRTIGSKEAGDGYLVEYEGGYQSWSPKAVFEKAYHRMTGLPFGMVVEALKTGMKAYRLGWNGKGQFIFLVDGSTFLVDRAPLDVFYPEGTWIDYRSHLDMKAVDGSIGPWVASQTDLLTEDWVITR